MVIDKTMALLFSACCLVGPPVLAADNAAGAVSVSTYEATNDTARSNNRVQTEAGWLMGRTENGATAFKGVPYAAPPVGDLRWRPPQPPNPFGLRQALQFSPPCPQVESSDTVKGSEDCLYLNLWTPAERSVDAALPVIVFLHGGGNVVGSASESIDILLDGAGPAPLYDGSRLAARGKLVVVTLNYRLAALGFLAHPAFLGESNTGSVGNYGLLDQLAALAWVRRNIAAFGGDPRRVLLLGHSGGAYDVCALVASPLARGLFTRAAMHSGVCTLLSAAEIGAHSRAVVAELGCAQAADIPACLRSVPLESIVLAKAAQPTGRDVYTMNPAVDGYIVPDQPAATIGRGEHNRVPFVVGVTAAELAHLFKNITPERYETLLAELVKQQPEALETLLKLYSLTDFPSPAVAVEAAYTDVTFRCPARTYARLAAANQTAPVYRFHFERVLAAPERLADGAYHGTDLLYLFQHMNGAQFAANAHDRAVEAQVLRYWRRFAATGDPNGDMDPAWSEYYRVTDPYLIVDVQTRMGRQLFKARCNFWDRPQPLD